LSEAIQKIGASVYQGQGVPGDGASGTDGSSQNPNPEAGPDVVEGEVKE
jgi:hypothetical protein